MVLSGCVLEAKGVTFVYYETKVLDSVSFRIEKGTVVSLLGPNGGGKSTLLKVLLGILAPVEGEVLLNGRRIREIAPRLVAREVAYVPQVHKMAFPYRVLDVVLMGRLPHKPFFFTYSKDDVLSAEEALARLSIAHLKDRPYTEISGGERQLTLIARAVAQGAHTFIMDEPSTGLDYGNQVRLLEEIMRLSSQGYTFIKSTHCPEHALWVSDRVLMLRGGSLLANGPPAEVMTEENLLRLYNVGVSMFELAMGLRVCMPKALKDDKMKMAAQKEV